MNIVIVITIAACVAVACADVSHLSSYNYPAPISTDVAGIEPKQTYRQSHSRPQIESIRPSVSLGSFTLHQELGQGPSHGSQSYSSVQSAQAHNYHGAQQQQQQHLAAPVQQQSYSDPSPTPVQQTVPVALAIATQRSYLSPALQKLHSSAPVSPKPIHQSFQTPGIAAVHHTFSSPASAPIQQQSYSAPAISPVAKQIFSAVLQEQSNLPPAPIQAQSFEFSGNNSHQQQPIGSVVSTSLQDNGAYSYQPLVQQQSLPASVTNSVEQSFPAPAASPLQQTYSINDNVQQQSHSISSNVAVGSCHDQPSLAGQQFYSGPTGAPVQYSSSLPISSAGHQTATGFSAVESNSYPYQPHSHAQQQYVDPVHLAQSVPAATPMQLAGLSGTADVDNGPLNYQIPTSAPATSPVSLPGGVEYSVPEPQRISLPVSELTAPVPTPEVGTVYGENGGYIYNKFN